MFTLDSQSGEVSLRQRVELAGQPNPLFLSRNQKVLYAGTRPDCQLVALSVDQITGELTILGAATAQGNPTYVATDDAQRVAFSASYGGDNLTVWPLDAAGIPQPASQIESGLPHAHGAVMDVSNRWLLVPMLGADAIQVYRLHDDGRLVPNDPPMLNVRAGSGPRHLRFMPDGTHLHCLNELDGTIDLLAFDVQTGVLALQQSVSMMPLGFAEAPWAAELRATPDGRFLYATDRRSSVIAAFAIESGTRRMTLIEHYPTETQPRGMAIDPSGRWLLVTGELSHQMTVYALDAETGRLTTHLRHATGLNPVCIEIGVF